MRVLMLSKALVVGAYQSKLEAMARWPGMKLTVVVPPYWREGNSRIALQRAQLAGYELIVQEMALNGHYHMHYYPGLGDSMRDARPDIVHIDEEPYNLATFQAMRLGRAAGACCLFFTWQNLYRPQKWNLCERYNLKQAAAAIAGNEEAAAILRRKGFTKPVTVIPQFGVDPDFFRRGNLTAERGRDLPFAVAPETFVIGYAGRMVEQKGLLVLLDAVAGLEGDWRLLLVGDGPLRSAIDARAAQLGIAERVRVVPGIPSTQMPRQLSMLDCLVLPSLTRPNWKEQFGRILVEAMACQVPVVGSDSGEIPNVIADAGMIAPEGDVAGLRRCLASLMADPTQRRRLGDLGRQRVLAHYTQASIAEATCRFYEQIRS